MKGIETGRYWDKPWSLVDGCTPCSPGCDHCWSKGLAERFGRWPVAVEPRTDRINDPLKVKKPTIFSIWNDLFHEAVSSAFVDRVMETARHVPRHTVLALTKRAREMTWYHESIRNIPAFQNVSNMWWGVTVCNQSEADAKIPELLKVPGHKWLSIEPMLGEIDLNMCNRCVKSPLHCEENGCPAYDRSAEFVVVGAETGSGRRPCNIEWIRSIVRQCKAAGVPVWVKAVEIERDVRPRPNNRGDVTWDVVKRVSHDMLEFPPDLRVREVPWTAKP